ncbi:Ankyrin repeat-containing domain protein [Akanthomyces lecanii RCEF 1005]|uniref:Ankyrin repeat-containing domain protein n=1 Tax=Akanthomyces lecanii RCEF 1005 TaxID=1081108 RepID=A0A167T2P3_CORDF|nr:Ankyrin repeat-containing domain protein [Akanthomyces lecanii RCEF 1005]
MLGLRNLPMELLLRVSYALSERDTCSLMRTCWLFYNTLQRDVYRRNIMHSRSTLLPYVVQAGNPQSISLVLSIDCKPSLSYLARSRQGKTALLAAIDLGDVDTALKLIDRGGQQINLRDIGSGWRPLTLAVVRNQEEIVKGLITKKVSDVNGYEDSKYHGAPLILAARSGRYRLVEILLTIKKLDRRVADRKLRTALDLAVIAGCWRTVHALLDDPFERDCFATYGHNPMFHAIASGNVNIVESLIQKNFAVIPPYLGKALQSGKEAVVRALLTGQAQLASAQWLARKALACAAEGGLLHFVETLLPSADSAERHEALLCAVEKKHWGVARLILDDDRAREVDTIFSEYPFASWYLLMARNNGEACDGADFDFKSYCFCLAEREF